jgi:hypothetical protein
MQIVINRLKCESTHHINRQEVDHRHYHTNNVSNKPLCLSMSFCRMKCKRYIIRNGCPTCECNPCVFDQPLNFTCGTGKHECLTNSGLCKVDAASDKISCCPKEHEGCCPYTPNIVTNDPNILFPCFPLCYTDADCKQGEKCCGTCPPRCMPAVIP